MNVDIETYRAGIGTYQGCGKLGIILNGYSVGLPYHKFSLWAGNFVLVIHTLPT